MSTIYTSAREREITNTIDARRKHEHSRVSVIVELDRRRIAARAAGKNDALLALADEYAALGCKQIAFELRRDASRQ